VKIAQAWIFLFLWEVLGALPSWILVMRVRLPAGRSFYFCKKNQKSALRETAFLLRISSFYFSFVVTLAHFLPACQPEWA